MKILFSIVLLITCSMLLNCGNDGKSKQTNSQVQTSEQSNKDWNAWIVKYEAFIDEYIVIVQKIQAGDHSAAMKAIDFAKKGQELALESQDLNKNLSDTEKEQFNIALEKIKKKMEDAGLE